VAISYLCTYFEGFLVPFVPKTAAAAARDSGVLGPKFANTISEAFFLLVSAHLQRSQQWRILLPD
jgi:hypothetical protein